MTATSTLARLVFEPHSVAGGLTQTFKRHGWSFAIGVHFVSGVGPDGQFGRMLHWLTDGAMYGIEMSEQRLGSDALDVRTPVPGLLLAGQDVSGPGIQAACMSGVIAAVHALSGAVRKVAHERAAVKGA